MSYYTSQLPSLRLPIDSSLSQPCPIKQVNLVAPVNRSTPHLLQSNPPLSPSVRANTGWLRIWLRRKSDTYNNAALHPEPDSHPPPSTLLPLKAGLCSWEQYQTQTMSLRVLLRREGDKCTTVPLSTLTQTITLHHPPSLPQTKLRGCEHGRGEGPLGP